jgi:bifunctional DNase/RNase
MHGPLAHLILQFAFSAGTGSTLDAVPPVPAGAELVELEVLGVVPLDAEPASVLVLRQKGGPIFLPILVGRSEGAAIQLRLKRAVPRHPQSADLLERAIAALGGRVTRVAIEAEQAALFRARVTLQQGERRLELEGRPSDSVALAVASHAPIFVSRQVLKDAGLAQEDLGRLRSPPPGPVGEQVGLGPAQSF